MAKFKCILAQIPASKRAYFVKKQSQLPSGDRNDPQILAEPWYLVMRRPVDNIGQKSDFYGTKTKIFRGPFTGDAGKATAEKIAKDYNETFHTAYVRD